MIDKELIDFAHYLADKSEIIAKNYFRLPNGEEAKSDDSPVTKADQEIEGMMRNEINKKYSDHGIIGEEYDNINENADFTWVLDPIDGTSSFIIGRPIFGTLIALTYKKQPILGIINQPITQERWLGVKDQGSWFNGQNIKTRKVTNIFDAVMCSSSPHYFQGDDQKVLQHLAKLTKYQKIGGVIYGGDCYSFACLAMGLVDIVIEPGLKCYDYAATQPLIEMAGGVVSDWNGNDLELKSNVRLLACANKELQKNIVREIALNCK